jgi:hypothetical protein
MTVGAFLLVELAAAATLALWTAVRFPQLAPGSLRATLAVLAGALLALQLLPAGVGAVVGLPAGPYLALFGAVLPCLVAAFLAVAWLMRLLAGFLGGSGGGGHRVPALSRR